jgi:hypothetical protein
VVVYSSIVVKNILTLGEITACLIGCSEKWRMHPPFVGKFDGLSELAQLAIPTNCGSIRRLSKYFDLSLVKNNIFDLGDIIA